MAQRVIIPRMGQTMTEGVVAKFYKKDGEPVAAGEDVYELEYDKSTATVQAKRSGTIRLLVAEGDSVPLGEAVAIILEDGETLESVNTAGAHSVANSAKAEAPMVPVVAAAATTAPAAGKVIASPLVKRLAAEMGIDLSLVTPGAPDGRLTKEDLEKYKQQAAAPRAGKVIASPLVKRLAAEMGIDLSLVTPSAPDGRLTKEDLEKYKQQAAAPAPRAGKVIASPLVKRLAAEMGIDLTLVTPSAPDGKLTKADLENYKASSAQPQKSESAYAVNPLARKLAAERGLELSAVTPADGRRITSADVLAAGSGSAASAEAVPDFMPKVKRTENMSGMRKAISKQMSASYFLYPTVTLTTDGDMGELMKLRKQLNAEYEKEGVKLTITDLLLKAVAYSLRDNEIVNTSLVDNKIVYYEDINIGLAVALDKGLVVPVIRHVDKLSLKELAAESKRLAGLAKSGGLSGDDMQGNTFALTNLGTMGIDSFNPIINPPNSAILGIGRTVEKPWVVNGEITIRPRAVFSITHDHRVIDGVPAANFLKSLVNYVENPAQLLDK